MRDKAIVGAVIGGLFAIAAAIIGASMSHDDSASTSRNTDGVETSASVDQTTVVSPTSSVAADHHFARSLDRCDSNDDTSNDSFNPRADQR